MAANMWWIKAVSTAFLIFCDVAEGFSSNLASYWSYNPPASSLHDVHMSSNIRMDIFGKDLGNFLKSNVKKAVVSGLIGAQVLFPISPIDFSSKMLPQHPAIVQEQTISADASRNSAIETQVFWANIFRIDQTVAAELPRGALLEEVWGYGNKYFIDKSFNGQDWDEIRIQFKTKLQNNPSESEFTLAQQMLKTLGDKYTRLLPAELYAKLSKYDLVGVGMLLGPSPDGPLMVGAPPIPGSASDQAGIQKGDLVVTINGVSTAKMTAFDVLDLTSNDMSKTMRFGIKKASGGPVKEYTLERTFNKVSNPVSYSMSEDRQKRKIGYIRLKEFNSVGKQNVREAIEDLEQQGAKYLVLDLRGNPGGAFQSAIGMASLFMDNKPVVNIVDSDGGKSPFPSASNQVVTDSPLVLLMDAGSASASEVLAGALHDNCRAVLVGDKSYGKGLIQAVYGLSDGSGLVMTVAKYQTPSGYDIQGQGIQPDISTSAPLKIPGVSFVSPDVSKINFDEVLKVKSMCKIE